MNQEAITYISSVCERVHLTCARCHTVEYAQHDSNGQRHGWHSRTQGSMFLLHLHNNISFLLHHSVCLRSRHFYQHNTLQRGFGFVYCFLDSVLQYVVCERGVTALDVTPEQGRANENQVYSYTVRVRCLDGVFSRSHQSIVYRFSRLSVISARGKIDVKFTGIKSRRKLKLNCLLHFTDASGSAQLVSGFLRSTAAVYRHMANTP